MSEKETLKGGELFLLETMADGLRHTGYKNTYNAIAEIVDNSIEAEAKDVFIIGNKDLMFNQECLNEFAFLDNGNGMSDDVLFNCLSYGYHKTELTTGHMSRFGVGLPQASFTVAPRVKVYSWKEDYKKAKMVYVDLNLVSSRMQDKIPEPKYEQIPEKYKKFINFVLQDKTYDFSKHGTLVIWESCDNVSHKKWNTCRRHLEFDLGRKYRKMLNNGQVEISTVLCDDVDTFSRILPNDPLFLMEKSMFSVKSVMTDTDCDCKPYNEDEGYIESMFEPFTTEDNDTGIVNKEVKYYDKEGNVKTANVKITFSIVKSKYYDKSILVREPGSLPHGKVAARNSGISIIRENREIDFDVNCFDFVNIANEPIHRWWGCEISFTAELDEAFQVSNNKQQVTLRKIDDDSIGDYDDYDVKPMWIQLRNTITNAISKMTARNSELRHGSRSTSGGSTTTATSEVVKETEKKNPDVTVEIKNKPEEITNEVIEKVTSELKEEGYDGEITEEQIKQYLSSNTRIKYIHSGTRGSFIDYSDELGVLLILINRDHKFYQDFVIKAYEKSDDMQLVFELFLAALVKSVYALAETNQTAMDLLINKVNDMLKAYLRQDD